MLHIVCANTSIDSRLEVDRFSIGDVIRAKKTSSFLSGKGVNSAFCINFLREECVVHCICGEFDKDLFSMHGLSNVKFEIVTAPGETRRNITIISNQDLIVHIQAQGFVVNDHIAKIFTDKFENVIREKDVVVISGSNPEGFGRDYFEKIRCKSSEKSCKIIVDVDLERVLSAKFDYIDYIKPNLEELERGIKISNFKNIDDFFNRLMENNIRNIIVSAGEDGVFLWSGDVEEIMHVYSHFIDTSIRETIGSGDAFVGGFASCMGLTGDLIYSMKRGVAAGHANLVEIGPGRIGGIFEKILVDCSVEYISKERFITYLERKMF